MKKRSISLLRRLLCCLLLLGLLAACGLLPPEPSSPAEPSDPASGSVATAVVLTADFADGITEIGIGQPGGTLEVGVQRTDGAVTGLSIGGAVRLTQTLTVTLPGPAAAPC